MHTHAINPTQFVDLGNVRPGPLKERYDKIQAEGIDPFEPEHFKKHHPYPILFENSSWLLTENAHPYDGTQLHLLLIHRKFITSPEEITPRGWMDLGQVISVAQEKYNYQSGAFFLRFGDTTQTGASVTHLHAHIVVPQIEEGVRKVIIPKIFPKEE